MVNTSQRELLLRGLDAIARERASAAVRDRGARARQRLARRLRAGGAREHPAVDETIALRERRGKALNDSELLRRARGRYALLLNEDSELQPGRHAARCTGRSQRRPRAACAGAQAAAPRRHARRRRAWRFPTPLTALAGALFLHRLLDGAEHGRAHARGRLVPVRGAARAGARRPSRSATSTPTSSSTPTRSTSPGACATPAGAACTCRARWRSTTSSSPPARPRAADRRAGAQPRPVHAQAPLRRRRARGALADRLDLRACARWPRSCCRGTRRAATGATSRATLRPGARRGPARGGRAEYNRAR